jgi:hypothetical protein
MADRGLYAAWLFEAIAANGWHPLLRVNGTLTFCPTGSETFSTSAEIVPQAGGAWKGSGAWSETGKRMQGTLAVRWEQGYDEAIAVVTDRAPAQVQASWDQMRFWIETEYKDGTRGWVHWEQSTMLHPQRASRLWLLFGVALQQAILLGIALEAREEAEQDRRRVASGRRAPVTPQKRPRGREQSVVLRGMMALRAAACGSGETLPQGRMCFEALPSQWFPLHKPSRSYQQKKQQKEERQRNRQRRRERAREARQEVKRQRQREKQAEAEATRAARMARREERAAQAARRQEKHALREVRQGFQMRRAGKRPCGPQERFDEDLARSDQLVHHGCPSRSPREEPLLRRVHGHLQPTTKPTPEPLLRLVHGRLQPPQRLVHTKIHPTEGDGPACGAGP